MQIKSFVVIALWVLIGTQPTRQARGAHPWKYSSESLPLATRVSPPRGFKRLSVPAGSFGAWLRTLPVKAGRPPVLLYTGARKGNQHAHYLVLDIDVGRRNLQQCADAVIRLRAEYLRASDADKQICFRFTSGEPVSWSRWAQGWRPKVTGQRVSWTRASGPSWTYRNFRRYLERIFIFAGSASLTRELRRVPRPTHIEAGDVFIQGGFPGHAVLVMDVVADKGGHRRFLLAQSYMPAQDLHILRNPDDPPSPWYTAHDRGRLHTPEWSFRYRDLKRFRDQGCPRPE